MEVNILVVDDDKEILKLIEIYLMNEGYKVYNAINGEEALNIVSREEIHLIVLDIMMPKLSGIEVCKIVREKFNIPILMLSAKSEDMDKIEGLMTGADDYLTKPFGIGELLARIRVSLRHKENKKNVNETSGTFKVKDLIIDYEKRKVTIENKEIHLTPIEYKLLVLLSKYPGKVLTHNFIIKEIWGASVGSETQTLRVFMASLRRKIEKQTIKPEYIYTEVGVGYRFTED